LLSFFIARNEPEFIDEIIEWVNSIIVNKTYFHVAQYPVGIDSRVEDVELLLDIEKSDRKCMVGIFGTLELVRQLSPKPFTT
jgi:hypothetical protein